MDKYSELALYLIEHYNEASPESAAGRALLELEARADELVDEKRWLSKALNEQTQSSRIILELKKDMIWIANAEKRVVGIHTYATVLKGCAQTALTALDMLEGNQK